MTKLNEKSLEIIAHRGGVGEIPENTDMALAYAQALGVKCFESDLRCSKDGVVFLQHDREISKIFHRSLKEKQLFSLNKPERKILFADLEARQIRQLSAVVASEALRKISESSPQRHLNSLTNLAKPITLEQALAEYPQLRFNLDVKEAAALTRSLNIVAKQQAWTRVTWASFSSATLKQVRQCESARTALSPGEVIRLRLVVLGMKLFRLDKRRDFRGPLPQLLRRFLALSPQAVALQIPEKMWGIRLLDRTTVHLARRLGLRIEPWTINSKEQARRLEQMGVDAIMTDYPQKLLELLES